mmetsp:Transcript_3257/g.12437  ORF Transcript_3257/g.12437 Transcript_3257/m.12437 type:complete len:107 (-) Transcript_3257:439-759(-)
MRQKEGTFLRVGTFSPQHCWGHVPTHIVVIQSFEQWNVKATGWFGQGNLYLTKSLEGSETSILTSVTPIRGNSIQCLNTLPSRITVSQKRHGKSVVVPTSEFRLGQ